MLSRILQADLSSSWELRNSAMKVSGWYRADFREGSGLLAGPLVMGLL